MGQEESKHFETEDMREIRELERKGGAAAVNSFIELKLNKWKTEPVSFAITGRSATGKSTFINAVRGVKPGDKDFAKQGSGDTTKVPTVYHHPQYNNILFCDLPGIGTMNVPADTYSDIMNFNKYDFFFIFFPDVINQNDELVAKEIIKLKKEFCFVRSKIDYDLECCIHDGVTKEEKIKEIKEKADELLERDPNLGSSSKIFYISSWKPQIGEMDLVMKYIQQKLPSVKHEAFINALACVSERIIDEKYKQLTRRLYIVTAAITSVSALPIPRLEMKINLDILIKEVKHYIEVFGLTENRLGDLYNDTKLALKCKAILLSAGKEQKAAITDLLGKTHYSSACEIAIAYYAKFDMFVGTVISSLTTAIFVYRFLSSQLENVKQDASAVYSHIQNKEKARFEK